VRDDGLRGLELAALAVQRDLDATGLEGDQVADRRHIVERRAVRPRGKVDALDVVVIRLPAPGWGRPELRDAGHRDRGKAHMARVCLP
jgi:hypothetical protein